MATLWLLLMIVCLSLIPTAFLPSSPTDPQWRDDDNKLDKPHLQQPTGILSVLTMFVCCSVSLRLATIVCAH